MAEVVCKLCDQVGVVEIIGIEGKTAEIIDKIDHLETCDTYKKAQKLLNRQPPHLQKKKWRKQERVAALLVGAHETPASGALNEDGDARSFHGVRLECKQTSSDTFILDSAVWTKLVQGAWRADEIPILQVELHGTRGLCKFYVTAFGNYEIDSREISQKSMRNGLRLRREDVARTPFHVTTMDPHPVVMTQRQLLEVMNESE